ncbi:proline-rich protein PRCC [Cimex lectularius]|uniref:Proline-rich protein PRCC n=1 Tax=Cimex lectularius TaxID=79782 RepID=A0A8I6RD62_CIMLE|nr:proline-rich protein PRCC [Cimex lectularius]
MSLVAYEFSDGEPSDYEEEEEKQEQPAKQANDEDKKEIPSTSKSVIKDDAKDVTNLPKSVGLKNVGLDIAWSLLDKHRIQPIRIPIPSVVAEETEVKKHQNMPPSKKGSGLFAVLPKPKSEMVSNAVKMKLKPTSLMRPKPVPKPKPPKPIVKTKESDSESDNEGEAGSFFFAPETDIKVDPTTAKQIAKELSEIEHKVAKSMEKPVVEEVPLDEVPLPEGEPGQPAEEVKLNDEILAKLCGTKDRRKAISEQFIDVDGSALVGDAQQWLVKELSKETPNPGKRKFEGTHMSKRKHQITYLAQHAKANELELQNQWANNRMTRKQTQAKYGF